LSFSGAHIGGRNDVLLQRNSVKRRRKIQINGLLKVTTAVKLHFV